MKCVLQSYQLTLFPALHVCGNYLWLTFVTLPSLLIRFDYVRNLICDFFDSQKILVLIELPSILQQSEIDYFLNGKKRWLTEITIFTYFLLLSVTKEFFALHFM